MARPVWESQSRLEVTRHRMKAAKLPFSPRIKDLYLLSAPRLGLISKKRKIKFLIEHAQLVSKMIQMLSRSQRIRVNGTLHRAYRVYAKDKVEASAYTSAKKTIAHLTNNPSGREVRLVFRLFAKHLVELEKAGQKQHIKKNLQKYLDDRQIPYDKKIFEESLIEFIDAMPRQFGIVGVQVDVFEQIYLSKRRARKITTDERNVLSRKVVRRVIKGKNLTRNQKKRVMGIAKREAKRAVKQLHSKGELNGLSESSIAKALEAEVNRIVEGIEMDVLPTYEKKEPVDRPNLSTVSTKLNRLRKSGTRKGRKNEYLSENGVRKKKSSKPVSTKVRDLVKEATPTRRKTNQVEVQLRTIRSENRAAANKFGTLLDERLLSTGSLSRLMTAGPLARRRFIDVIEETDFLDHFGGEGVETLARGVAYIGPTGNKVDIVKNVFNENGFKKMYSFLLRNNVIKLHSGRRSIYLARSKR
jgi:hypothetical protein